MLLINDWAYTTLHVTQFGSRVTHNPHGVYMENLKKAKMQQVGSSS